MGQRHRASASRLLHLGGIISAASRLQLGCISAPLSRPHLGFMISAAAWLRYLGCIAAAVSAPALSKTAVGAASSSVKTP